MIKLFKKADGSWSAWKIIKSLLLLIVLVGAAFLGYLMSDIRAALNHVEEEITVETIRPQEVDLEKGDPINILLVGSDADELARTEDDGFISRSDTLMLINLNPETQQTKMLSIPRDTLARIDGRPGAEKINHAFAYGGINLTIDTIQDYLKVPIDYYAVVNMSGLEEMIDAIGGIEVTSPLTFEYRGTGFVKGETRHVNGVKAMNFARMRYDDPQGEVGRQMRQKIVIKAIMDKVISLNGVTNLSKMIQVAQKNVVTNVNFDEILNLYKLYLPATHKIVPVSFEQLEELYIDQVFYFHIPLASRVKVANEFRRNSDLKAITAKDLSDPLENDERPVKTLAMIINQYPTGLSEDEINRIRNEQQEIIHIRENPVQNEPVPEVSRPPVESSTPEEPSYSVPEESSSQPPESSTAPPESSSPPEESEEEPEFFVPIEPDPEPEPEFEREGSDSPEWNY